MASVFLTDISSSLSLRNSKSVVNACKPKYHASAYQSSVECVETQKASEDKARKKDIHAYSRLASCTRICEAKLLDDHQELSSAQSSHTVASHRWTWAVPANPSPAYPFQLLCLTWHPVLAHSHLQQKLQAQVAHTPHRDPWLQLIFFSCNSNPVMLNAQLFEILLRMLFDSSPQQASKCSSELWHVLQ